MQGLRSDVYSIRAIDWDRRLFDEPGSLLEGTSFNADLVEGREQTAFLDTVDLVKQTGIGIVQGEEPLGCGPCCR